MSDTDTDDETCEQAYERDGLPRGLSDDMKAQIRAARAADQ